MSSTNRLGLPQPSWRVRRRLFFAAPESDSEEAAIEFMVGISQLVGSPGYRASPEQYRSVAAAQITRSVCPEGTHRQLAAGIASGSLVKYLPSINAPTLVIHGVGDPLMPVECGFDVARNIKDATLKLYSGMGHDIPAGLIPSLVAQITSHANGAIQTCPEDAGSPMATDRVTQ